MALALYYKLVLWIFVGLYSLLPRVDKINIHVIVLFLIWSITLRMNVLILNVNSAVPIHVEVRTMMVYFITVKYDADCFRRHKDSVCKKIRIYEKWDKFFVDVQSKFQHDCVNLKCNKCDGKYNPKKDINECFMKPLKKKNDNKWLVKNDLFTFYHDEETYIHSERVKRNGNAVVDICL